jgi:hypothetical protein
VKITKTADTRIVQSGRILFWGAAYAVIGLTIAAWLLLANGRITNSELATLVGVFSVAVATLLSFQTAVTVTFDLIGRRVEIRTRTIAALWRSPLTHTYNEVAGVGICTTSNEGQAYFIPMMVLRNDRIIELSSGYPDEDQALQIVREIRMATGLPRHVQS